MPMPLVTAGRVLPSCRRLHSVRPLPIPSPLLVTKLSNNLQAEDVCVVLNAALSCRGSPRGHAARDGRPGPARPFAPVLRLPFSMFRIVPRVSCPTMTRPESSPARPLSRRAGAASSDRAGPCTAVCPSRRGAASSPPDSLWAWGRAPPSVRGAPADRWREPSPLPLVCTSHVLVSVPPVAGYTQRTLLVPWPRVCARLRLSARAAIASPPPAGLVSVALARAAARARGSEWRRV